jgi:hypothetical protein
MKYPEMQSDLTVEFSTVLFKEHPQISAEAVSFRTNITKEAHVYTRLGRPTSTVGYATTNDAKTNTDATTNAEEYYRPT